MSFLTFIFSICLLYKQTLSATTTAADIAIFDGGKTLYYNGAISAPFDCGICFDLDCINVLSHLTGPKPKQIKRANCGTDNCIWTAHVTSSGRIKFENKQSGEYLGTDNTHSSSVSMGDSQTSSESQSSDGGNGGKIRKQKTRNKPYLGTPHPTSGLIEKWVAKAIDAGEYYIDLINGALSVPDQTVVKLYSGEGYWLSIENGKLKCESSEASNLVNWEIIHNVVDNTFYYKNIQSGKYLCMNTNDVLYECSSSDANRKWKINGEHNIQNGQCITACSGNPIVPQTANCAQAGYVKLGAI